MLVVADTSPLHYLVLVDAVSILPSRFGRIRIPRAVMDELQHTRTPQPIGVWLASSPAWLDMRPVGDASDTALAHLDRGEREAIFLAWELGAGLLLMDDWEGRQEARRRALTVTGTLGLMERAAQRGLLDLRTTLARLQATNFYLPVDLVRELLVRDAVSEGRG